MTARPPVPATPRRGIARSPLASLYRNGFALTGSALTSAGLGFAYWSLVAHRADPAMLGTATATIAALTGLSLIAQLSLGGFIISHLPRAGARSGRLVRASYATAAATSMAIGAGFALLTPQISPALAWLAHPSTAVMFGLAVTTWSVFGLQDNVLTGLRSASWIPLENGVYALAKLVILAVAGTPTVGVVLASWTLPAAVLVAPMSWLIFRRLLPTHMGRSQVVQITGWQGYLARDTLGLVCSVAATTMLPVLVLACVGPVASANFGLAWLLAQALDLVSINMGMSLTAEGAYAERDVRDLLRALRRRIVPVVVASAVLGSVAAPLLLRLFGHGYAAARPVLIMLLAATAVRSVTLLSICAARSARRSGRVLTLQILPAALVPSLTALLAPRFGLAGAGLAYLLGHGVVAGYALLTEPRPAPAQNRACSHPLHHVRTPGRHLSGPRSHPTTPTTR